MNSTLEQNQIEISRSELKDILVHLKGCQPVTVVTLTDARATKFGNQYGLIMKRSRVNGFIGFNYGNCVNNQRVREEGEPDFQPVQRKWGNRVNGTPVVEHKGRTYLELFVRRSLEKPRYFDNANNELNKSDIAAFLPITYSNADYQGVEKEIILRDYKLESIESITMGGMTYVVK